MSTNNQHTHELEQRLAEAEATIAALLSGEIDAVVDAKSQTPILLSAAQDALRLSEERYRRIIETTNQGVWMIDGENKTTFMNRRMEIMLGCEPGTGLGRSVLDFLDEEGRASLASHVGGGSATQVEVRYIRTDGTRLWALVEATSELDSAGNYQGSFAMIKDISERKQAEAALRASEARFKRLWDSGIILLTISDLRGKIIEINDAGLRMLGYTREDLVGRLGWDDLTPPESRETDVAARAQLLATSVATPWEKELIRKDGTRVPILAAAAILGGIEGIAIAIDLTERKRAESELLDRMRANAALESQLRQSQKMEAVGRLAGGIAHDFNNILSVILSCGELLLEDLKPMDPARADVEEICKAGTRAASLTRQLLMFSRQQVLEPKILDLSVVTASMESMLRRVLGEDVELVFHNPPELGRVLVDPGSIEQVIMNLVVNARDAMPTGGELTIVTRNERIDDSLVDDRFDVKPGRYVVLSVTDTGTGIDAATQARIFEPFFTTKEVGKGTGLGLSTVFGIVHQSSGAIRVHSELGAGTTFSIYLPYRDDAADVVRVTQPRAAFRGTETILLVEDEDQVRNVASGILQRHGYRVIEMRSAAAALMYCQSRPEKIDLLLTDVVMPQMSGPELARCLLELRPNTKVLCMSGYADDSVVRHGVARADIALLQKPFTPESLARKVREILDAVTKE